MTLEEIKSEIRSHLSKDKYETYAYFCGKHNALVWVLEKLDSLEPSWHPYPAEKPEEKNGYVVSVVDESNGYCFTDASFYHPNLDRFEIDDVYQLHVYAWAERPKPYKKEINNDH